MDENEAHRKLTSEELAILSDTARDVFGRRYEGVEEEMIAKLRRVCSELDDRHLEPREADSASLGKVCSELDDRHLALVLRIIDLAPIIGMLMEKLQEFADSATPRGKMQAELALKISAAQPIRAALMYLPPKLRREVYIEAITELERRVQE